MRLCGVYFNRGKMIMTAVYLPLVVMLIFAEKIFIALGQDEKVSYYAFVYMKPMIPALFFLGMFDLSKRFLTCVQHASIPMVAQMIGLMIHIGLCFYFVKHKEMDVFGLGLTTLISYASMYFIVTIHANFTTELKKALSWPTKKSFQDWWSYIRIAVPAVVMMCSECWAFDCMAFVAGILSI